MCVEDDDDECKARGNDETLGHHAHDGMPLYESAGSKVGLELRLNLLSKGVTKAMIDCS